MCLSSAYIISSEYQFSKSVTRSFKRNRHASFILMLSDRHTDMMILKYLDQVCSFCLRYSSAIAIAYKIVWSKHQVCMPNCKTEKHDCSLKVVWKRGFKFGKATVSLASMFKRFSLSVSLPICSIWQSALKFGACSVRGIWRWRKT